MIQTTNFNLSCADNISLFVRKWQDNDQQPKATIQIAHGMAEHSSRYDHFARFLAENGFIVYADDHRGHGETAKTDEQLGFFSENDGWNKLINDSLELSKKIIEENPSLPLFLLGHSMGSFIVRNLIISPAVNYKAAVLSGTTGDPGAIAVVGKLIAKLLAAFQGKKGKNNFLYQTGFGKFNAPFKPARTEFDWLSRDNKVVDDYAADPKCGMVMSIGFMLDLTFGLEAINSKDAFNNTPKELPILLTAGEKDPVSNGGIGVKEVFENYKNAGIKNLTLKLYPESRHEILNELNKEEVYENILKWINAQL
jgi:alpha-beta hydrolase superfamily lysophospholipase